MVKKPQTFRFDEDLIEALKEASSQRGCTVTAFLEDAAWGKLKGIKPPKLPDTPVPKDNPGKVAPTTAGGKLSIEDMVRLNDEKMKAKREASKPKDEPKKPEPF